MGASNIAMLTSRSLMLSTLLFMALVPQISRADHGVLDVEFPPIREPVTTANVERAFEEAMSKSKSAPRVVVFTNQLYRLRLLGLNNPLPGVTLSHVASVAGYPDLPRWTFLRPHKDDLLLYGTQPNSGTIDIQIISTNQETFDVYINQLQLQVEPREVVAQYEVEMKIINYNVEDVFEREILPRLERVLRPLWSTSSVIFTSKLAAVLDVGGRKPLDPRHKEGFVVRIAGNGNFSSELRNLELEVRQLRNRIPCPRDYKRTSVEWRFREVGLVLDWCGFRLITDLDAVTKASQRAAPGTSQSATLSNSHLAAAAAAASDSQDDQKMPVSVLPDGNGASSQQNNGNNDSRRKNTVVPPTFEGPSLEDLPRRSSFEDVLVSLALPLVICILLLGGLSGTSLCLYASEASASTDHGSITARRDSNEEAEDPRRLHTMRHDKN